MIENWIGCCVIQGYDDDYRRLLPIEFPGLVIRSRFMDTLAAWEEMRLLRENEKIQNFRELIREIECYEKEGNI